MREGLFGPSNRVSLCTFWNQILELLFFYFFYFFFVGKVILRSEIGQGNSDVLV